MRLTLPDHTGRLSFSPLQYPGGKARAIHKLHRLLPAGVTHLCSPFVGGAHLELMCAARGIEVAAYDVFEPLVNFWQMLLADPAAVANAARPYCPMQKDIFYRLKKDYHDLPDNLTKAAAFVALNATSFSGLTLSGGMSEQKRRRLRWSPSYLARLSEFEMERFTVNEADFRDSIPAHPDHFLYLDPPYLIGSALYGHDGDTHRAFDHAALADLLRNRGRWMLSYNDSDDVRGLYDGFEIRQVKWNYGMGANKRGVEIVIFSRDITPPLMPVPSTRRHESATGRQQSLIVADIN